METSLTPHPPTPAEIEIEQNYHHNFIVNALDGGTFWFGYSFMSPAIILPLYLSHFTNNPILIGLLPFIGSAFFLIPQLFTANFVERAPVKKDIPVKIGFFTERVPIFLLPLTVVLFAVNNPPVAVASFFFLYAWHSVGAGSIIVAWQDMIGKIIPFDRRGRFFGITNFAGTASGILGALVVTAVLTQYEFPQAFVFSFSAAAILVFISWFFIAMTREPAVPSTKPRISQMVFLRSLPRILRKDLNFRRYLGFQIINAFSLMASSFLAVYSTQKWGLPDSYAGGYIIAFQVGQALANLFFGYLSDRKGHKLNLEINALINAGSLILAILARSPYLFFLIFFLRGAIQATNQLSGISIVLEFTRPEDRPTYIGMANTIPGIVASLAPLFAGWLAATAGYEWMFAVAAAAILCGFVLLHWKIDEPRFTKATNSTRTQSPSSQV
jgi:MFS family permease